jgi:sugar phosphate isomerase/epimerase
MDMSRVSACSYALNQEPLDKALAVIADAGFTLVDLWGRAPHFSTLLTESKPRAIEKALEKHGLTVANIGSYCGREAMSKDRAVRHKEMGDICRTMDLAVRFGARSIRVSPGIGTSPKLADDIVDFFARSALYAATKGIYMGMENHEGSIAGEPELAAKLCEGVESRYFGVIYEPCNLLEAGKDYKQAFEMQKDWIVHVHVKDGRWVDGSFQRCHLGQGDIDIPWLLSSLQSIGYEGHFALEYECWDVEPVETGLKRWREWWEAL